MRSGENAKDVIDRVKKRLDEIRPGLPPGVEIHTAYDRSTLITAAVGTLDIFGDAGHAAPLVEEWDGAIDIKD